MSPPRQTWRALGLAWRLPVDRELQGSAMRRLRVFLSTAVLAVSATTIGASADTADAEGCVAGAQTASCSYRATKRGNIVASGRWVVTVTRPDGRVTRYRGAPARDVVDVRALAGSWRTIDVHHLHPFGNWLGGAYFEYWSGGWEDVGKIRMEASDQFVRIPLRAHWMTVVSYLGLYEWALW